MCCSRMGIARWGGRGGGENNCLDSLERFFSMSKWAISYFRGVKTLAKIVCALFCSFLRCQIRDEKKWFKKKVLHSACLRGGGVKSYFGNAHMLIYTDHFSKRA